MSNSSAAPSASKSAMDTAIRIGLMAILTGWCLYIALPFIAPLIWGIIIAIGSYPLYLWLQAKTGLGNALAATLFTAILLALLILPTVILSNALLEEARVMSKSLEQGTLRIVPPADSVADWPLIGEQLYAFWNQASLDPKAALGEYESQIRQLAAWMVKKAAGVGLGILLFIFSLIIAGLFLATAGSGRKAAETIMCRLLGDRGKELTDLAHSTVRSVVNGILGIALLQALLAGLGFVAMGIPGAGALALVCLVLAVVQIDILIILIPLSIYAFSTAGTAAAIAFLIWNIAVGLMNNILKPILLGRGVKAPMAVIFIGAIGGLIAHGIIGLFVGAVIFVLGYTLFTAWLDEAAVE